jgi:hypothetical protein
MLESDAQRRQVKGSMDVMAAFFRQVCLISCGDGDQDGERALSAGTPARRVR